MPTVIHNLVSSFSFSLLEYDTIYLYSSALIDQQYDSRTLGLSIACSSADLC